VASKSVFRLYNTTLQEHPVMVNVRGARSSLMRCPGLWYVEVDSRDWYTPQVYALLGRGILVETPYTYPEGVGVVVPACPGAVGYNLSAEFPPLSAGGPGYALPGPYPKVITIGPLEFDCVVRSGDPYGANPLVANDQFTVNGSPLSGYGTAPQTVPAGTAITTLLAGQTVTIGVYNLSSASTSASGYLTAFPTSAWLGFWTGASVANLVPGSAGIMDLPVDAPEVVFGGYQATEILTNAQAEAQGMTGADFIGGSALGWGLGGNRGRRAMLNTASAAGITFGAVVHHHPSTPYPIGLSVRNAAATVAWGIVPNEGFYADGVVVSDVPLIYGTHLVTIELTPSGWKLRYDNIIVRQGAHPWNITENLQIGAFVDRGSRGYYNNIFAVPGTLCSSVAAALLQNNTPRPEGDIVLSSDGGYLPDAQPMILRLEGVYLPAAVQRVSPPPPSGNVDEVTFNDSPPPYVEWEVTAGGGVFTHPFVTTSVNYWAGLNETPPLNVIDESWVLHLYREVGQNSWTATVGVNATRVTFGLVRGLTGPAKASENTTAYLTDQENEFGNDERWGLNGVFSIRPA
jgi:hypothetical protein